MIDRGEPVWDTMRYTVTFTPIPVFPTGLIVGNLTAGLIGRQLEKYGVHLSRSQISYIIKEIKRYKKTHDGWKLIEAEDGSGSVVSLWV